VRLWGLFEIAMLDGMVARLRRRRDVRASAMI